MQCRDIRELLPAFLDDGLSVGEKKEVEAHLAGCPLCARELKDLGRTVEMVGGLSQVEPPPFFAKKIKARVRAEAAPKPGLLHRLFFPLHVKLPLEAIATVFVAVLAVYVYQAVGPEPIPPRGMEPTRVTEHAPAVKKAEEAPPTAVPADEARAPIEEQKPATAQPVETRKKAEFKKEKEAAPRKDDSKKRDVERRLKSEPGGEYASPPPEVLQGQVVQARGPRTITASGEEEKKMKGADKKGGEGLGFYDAAESSLAKQKAAPAPSAPAPKAKMERALDEAPAPAAAEAPTVAADDVPTGRRLSMRQQVDPSIVIVERPEAVGGATEEQKKPTTGMKMAKRVRAAPPATAPDLERDLADESQVSARKAPVFGAPAKAQAEPSKAEEADSAKKEEKKVPRSIVVQVGDPAAAGADVARIVANLGGRVTAKQIREGRDVYVVEVRGQYLKALVEKVGALGTVKASFAVSGDEGGTVTVRVEIVR